MPKPVKHPGRASRRVIEGNLAALVEERARVTDEREVYVLDALIAEGRKRLGRLKRKATA